MLAKRYGLGRKTCQRGGSRGSRGVDHFYPAANEVGLLAAQNPAIRLALAHDGGLVHVQLGQLVADDLGLGRSEQLVGLLLERLQAPYGRQRPLTPRDEAQQGLHSGAVGGGGRAVLDVRRFYRGIPWAVRFSQLQATRCGPAPLRPSDTARRSCHSGTSWPLRVRQTHVGLGSARASPFYVDIAAKLQQSAGPGEVMIGQTLIETIDLPAELLSVKTVGPIGNEREEPTILRARATTPPPTPKVVP